MPRKKTILFLTAFVFCLPVFGQRIAFSLESGGILSRDQRFDYFGISYYRKSYFLGADVLVSPKNKTSYVAGIHYLRQGYQHSTCYIVAPGANSNLIGKIDQLAIPFLIRKKLFNSDQLFASLGLYVAHNVRAFADVPVAIGGCEIGYVSDLRPMNKLWSAGSVVGLEYVVHQKERHELGLHLRYYQGISNAAKPLFVNHSAKPVQRRSSIALNFFIRFDAYNAGD